MLKHYTEIEYEYERHSNCDYRPSTRLGIPIVRRNVKSIPDHYLKSSPTGYEFFGKVIRYRFYDVETENGISVKCNYSGWNYFGGDIYTFEEFAEKFPSEKRPSNNLVDTIGANQIIRSHNIAFLFNNKKDRVI